MPPIRQSTRNRQQVQPYQAADAPRLTQQQLRRENARYRQVREQRDGVPQLKEEVIKRIKKDAKLVSIAEAKTIQLQLGSVIRSLSKGKASKITEFRENAENYSRAFRKYNNGDFEMNPHFDAFSQYSAPQ